MKNPKHIPLFRGSTALLLGVLLLAGLNAFVQGQPNASGLDREAPQLSTNPPPPGFATRWDYVKSFTNENDILNAYHAGLINYDEDILAMGRLGNTASVDTYGKVVDQNGQPIVGVDVRGRVERGIGDYEDHNTETDAQGLFHFLGLHGQGLILDFQKKGYDFDERWLPERPSDYLPDSNSPLVFTMWKVRGAEPIIHNQFESRVPYNGTSAIFNLMTGKKTADGDLKITLSRSPLNIHRGRDKYDWTAKIELINGGLIVENDQYPYWAPETGYQSVFEASMSSNNVPWSAELRQNFYIKNAQNQYGRLFIDLFTDSMRPNTGITVETWINPSGSQNLEFDPRKQIH